MSIRDLPSADAAALILDNPLNLFKRDRATTSDPKSQYYVISEASGKVEARTLLMVAASVGALKCVHAILNAWPASEIINIKSSTDQKTALHCACEALLSKNHTIMTNLIATLVRFGGDLSATDHLGRTAQAALAASMKNKVNNTNEEGTRLPKISTNSMLEDGRYTTDEFRMYQFKIEGCPHLNTMHDWTDCPYLHPGEKARRRDPRFHKYHAHPCPDFRKSACRRGDSCPYAHGVFECWLHPSKYRTQLCKEGAACDRGVCFFAHSMEQLREPPPESIPDGSPRSLQGVHGIISTATSPRETSRCTSPGGAATTQAHSNTGSLNNNSTTTTISYASTSDTTMAELMREIMESEASTASTCASPLSTAAAGGNIAVTTTTEREKISHSSNNTTTAAAMTTTNTTQTPITAPTPKSALSQALVTQALQNMERNALDAQTMALWKRINPSNARKPITALVDNDDANKNNNKSEGAARTTTIAAGGLYTTNNNQQQQDPTTAAAATMHAVLAMQRELARKGMLPSYQQPINPADLVPPQPESVLDALAALNLSSAPTHVYTSTSQLALGGGYHGGAGSLFVPGGYEACTVVLNPLAGDAGRVNSHRNMAAGNSGF